MVRDLRQKRGYLMVQHWQKRCDVSVRGIVEVPPYISADILRLLVEDGLEERSEESSKVVDQVHNMSQEILGLF